MHIWKELAHITKVSLMDRDLLLCLGQRGCTSCLGEHFPGIINNLDAMALLGEGDGIEAISTPGVENV